MDKTASKIKKFFAKKKTEAKFKLAGPGRVLNAEPTTSSSKKPSKDAYVPVIRDELSAEAKAARDAAMNRFDGRNNKNSKDFNTSLAAIKAQVKRELEAENQQKTEHQQPKEKPAEKPQEELAAQGVYFRCPMISEEILPRKEWKIKIKEFLYEQLEEDLGLTASLIIHNCNLKDKADACIETLKKYLENIIQNPGEEKFQKIRCSNRIFQEKVANVEGSKEFLKAAGFVEKDIEGEIFLVWTQSDDVGELVQLHEALGESEIIPLELDRNIQVLLPSQARKTTLPSDFFRISPEEIKREQQLRAEALESSQVLMTKAMREKEEMRVRNKYRFALIRIRFPDGVFLQGTFNVYEHLDKVYEFVQSCLKVESAEFTLIVPHGGKLSTDVFEETLFNLRLIPNTILNFSYEGESKSLTEYLKEELMILIQPM